MRRARLALVALAVVATTSTDLRVAAADAAVQGFDPAPVPPPVEPLRPGPPSACGEGSWVAGTVDVCAGEVVYRDYVYDDFGASLLPGPPPDVDLLSLQPTTIPTGGAYGFLPPAGNQQQGQPEDRKATTDLVGVRLRRSGSDIAVAAELNALFDAATSRVVLAVDRDADATTGGGPLPGLVANPSLALPASIAGWDGDLVDLDCDAGTNRCTGAFATPPGAFRVWAMAVRADDGAVMNVAFRGVDETGFWWDARQAAALFGGDLTPYALEVRPADLDPATTRRAETPRGRVLQRVYVSDHPLGEGVSDSGVPGPGHVDNPLAGPVSQGFNLLGRYQPYGFYLPEAPGPHGVQLVLHGLAENHSARLYFPGTDGSFSPVVGEANDRILVAALGRGWRNWWGGHGERDAWDALGDAVANYDVDPRQRFVSGLSMGGYGTLRLGALFPDLWAGALNWVGWTGDLLNGTPVGGQFADGGSGGGALGNALDLVGNLRHVPIANVYGAADELVHVHQALALRSELARLRVPSMFWLHPTGEHGSSIAADDWSKESAWSAGRTLVARPNRVTFRTDERLFLPDLGLVPDHAYWVRAIDPAAPGHSDVEAFSAGCGGSEPVHEVRDGVGPVDPPPLLTSMSQEVVEVGRTPVAPADRVELTLRNVASLAVDVVGACLGDGPVDYLLRTDGPTTLRLTDGRTLSAPGPGEWAGTLAAVADLQLARAGEPMASAPAALARSGGSAPLGVAVVLVALGVAARWAAMAGSAPIGQRRYGR